MIPTISNNIPIKKLGIMQPYFFPYIGYFQAIRSVDKYVFYDNLQYTTKSWINRNRFLIRNGEPSFFHAKIKDKSISKKICEIELDEDSSWRKKLLNDLYYNYKSCPYFEEIYPLAESVILANVCMLSDINIASILAVCEYLDIKTELTRNTAKYLSIEEKLAQNGDNLMEAFPGITLANYSEKVIRVIEMCRMEEATVYINLIGGQLLYDKHEFKVNHIDLLFLQTREHSYPQPANQFYTHLSIIDVLMNCGKQQTQKLLQEYDLI